MNIAKDLELKLMNLLGDFDTTSISIPDFLDITQKLSHEQRHKGLFLMLIGNYIRQIQISGLCPKDKLDDLYQQMVNIADIEVNDDMTDDPYYQYPYN